MHQRLQRSLHGLLTVPDQRPTLAVPEAVRHRRPPAPASWQPLLAPSEAEQALALAADIAEALVRTVLPGRKHAPLSPALGRGLSGIALFFAYLESALPGRGYGTIAGELANEAIEGMDGSGLPEGLYPGFLGVAWLVEHLEGWILDFGDEDAGEEIVEAVGDLLQAAPWRDEWDLVGGLTGFGVYALERRPRPGSRECLERVVDRLSEIAERSPEGVTWRKRQEHLLYRPDLYPDGLYNLGIAHGIPGVIGLLGEIWATGVAHDRVSTLLPPAVDWLLAQKLPPGAGGSFPPLVAPGITPTAPSRLAWCYGDLGIAAILLGAGRRAGRTDWEAEALSLARGAAARPAESTEVVDAGLCHGAIGLSHLFNRLFQATGDPLLGAAARSWLDRGLGMRRPGEGLAGFLAWQSEHQNGDYGWRIDPGFLYGGAGIGLALLAAATPIEPAWDRVLLASIPPEGEDLP